MKTGIANGCALCQIKNMLTHGEHIRLSTKEQVMIEGLTGSPSGHIKNRTQLKQYVRAHLVNYPGRNPEELLLRKMLASFLPD